MAARRKMGCRVRRDRKRWIELDLYSAHGSSEIDQLRVKSARLGYTHLQSVGQSVNLANFKVSKAANEQLERRGQG